MRAEFARPLEQRFSSLPPEAVAPLGTEDRTPVSPLDRLARRLVFSGSLDLPVRAAAEDLQNARTRNDTPIPLRP